MNRKLQGILIRQRRQELNWSQAGVVCRDLRRVLPVPD